MEFKPAGEIIGIKHQVRTVGLRKSPRLPDGDYTFVDSYCTDASCDCRRTLIQVLLNGIHVSTIGFGWESPEFYRKWMGVESNYDLVQQMHGATIDITSPNMVSPQGMLAFFNALLNDNWITVFRRNYDSVKAQLAIREKQKNRYARRVGPT